MIALYEHIQQRACYMTRRERAAVRAELAKRPSPSRPISIGHSTAPSRRLCEDRS